MISYSLFFLLLVTGLLKAAPHRTTKQATKVTPAILGMTKLQVQLLFAKLVTMIAAPNLSPLHIS